MAFQDSFRCWKLLRGHCLVVYKHVSYKAVWVDCSDILSYRSCSHPFVWWWGRQSCNSRCH